MGCDYYVVTCLRIAFSPDPEDPSLLFKEIMLKKESKYYTYSSGGVDSDDEGYEQEVKKIKEQELYQYDRCIPIYEDGAYVRRELQLKYDEIISQSMSENYPLATIKRVDKVIYSWER